MKQPNWKMPLILSISLAVVSTTAYWLEFKHKPEKEKSDSSLKKPLFLDETTQISAVYIRGSNSEFKLQCMDMPSKKCAIKETAKWNIVSNGNLPGDPANVRSLINSAASLLASDTIDLSEEPKEKIDSLLTEYGVSETDRANKKIPYIEFELENQKRIRAYFGNVHPLGDKSFVLQETEKGINTKTVFLISNFFKSNFDHNLTYWREKALFALDRHDVVSFNLSSTKGNLSATSKDGLWSVSKSASVSLPGDSERIGTLLASFANAKAKDFPAKEIAGSKKTLSLQAKLKDGKAASIEISEKDTLVNNVKTRFYYAKTLDKDVSKFVEVDSAIVTALEKSFNDLRNTRLMNTTEKITATEATITGKDLGGIWKFSLDKGNWKADADTKADAAKLKDLLDLLSEGQIKEFKGAANPNMDKTVTLTLGNKENPKRSQFLFWKEKEALMAKDLNSKLPESFWINEAVQKNLPWSKEDWKTK